MRTFLHLDEIIFAITLLLIISAVAIPLARKFGMGADLGLLLAGVILGSSHVLGPTQVDRMREISELGVVFFLFLIGLELDLRKLWSLRRYAVVLGTLQMLMTGFVLMFYWRLFAPSWSLALLLGLVISSSSTALVLQMLASKGELEQEHGRAAFGVLLFQDLAVVPIMVLIPVFAGTGSAGSISWGAIGKAGGIILLLFAFGRWICPWLFRLTLARNMADSFTAVIFIAILGGAWLASRAGLSMAMGAFLMGLAFSGTTSVLPLYLEASFGVTERTFGLFLAYFGVLSLVMRILLLGPIVDRLGERGTVRVGCVVLLLGCLLYPAPDSLVLLALLVMPLMPIGTALLFPSTTSLISGRTAKSELGVTMGVAQTFGGVARASAPIVSTMMFQHLGHSWPFFVSAALVGVVGMLA